MNKGSLNITSLVLLIIGTTLIWCGITDRNPVDVIRGIFGGAGVPAKGSWSSATSSALKDKGTTTPSSNSSGGSSGTPTTPVTPITNL